MSSQRRLDAQLRAIFTRIHRQYGWPSSKKDKATNPILQPANVLPDEWAVT